MGTEKIKELIEEMHTNNSEVLENIASVHGHKVALSLHSFLRLARTTRAIDSILGMVKFPEEIRTAINGEQMEAPTSLFCFVLTALGLTEKEIEELLNIASGLIERDVHTSFAIGEEL